MHLGPRAGLPLRAVTPKDVRSFRDAERRLGKSSVTANLAHKIVASALGAAVKMGYMATNPASAVDYLPTHEAKAQKGTFTPEEIAALLKAAPSDDWRGVILLGAFAGMRLGDALRLKWGNVDLQARGDHLHALENRKAREEAHLADSPRNRSFPTQAPGRGK